MRVCASDVEERTPMKRSISVLTGLVLALTVAGSALAGPPITGKTTLVDTPTSGQTLSVDASIHSNTPVVPYEYAIRNECGIAGKPGYSTQQDDIVNWTSQDGAGDPHVTMPIYLQSVPSHAKCKVFLIRNGTVTVKGSTTSYTVG
jgi:hypothetical protein